MSADLSTTISPKSDQLNSDDLITGPRTIKVTKVSMTGAAEQPIAIHFAGDDNKPFKPSKSMRRLLVHVWGKDGEAYVGKSMTLFREPTVQFGGVAVGGIRISHMSDIDAPVTLALTASRASRKPYTVKPLVVEAATAKSVELPIAERADKFEAVLRSKSTVASLAKTWNSAGALLSQLATEDSGRLESLETIYKELFAEASEGVSA